MIGIGDFRELEVFIYRSKNWSIELLCLFSSWLIIQRKFYCVIGLCITKLLIDNYDWVPSISTNSLWILHIRIRYFISKLYGPRIIYLISGPETINNHSFLFRILLLFSSKWALLFHGGVTTPEAWSSWDSQPDYS